MPKARPDKQNWLPLVARRLDSFHATNGTNAHSLSMAAGLGSDGCRTIRQGHEPKVSGAMALAKTMGVAVELLFSADPDAVMPWEHGPPAPTAADAPRLPRYIAIALPGRLWTVFDAARKERVSVGCEENAARFAAPLMNFAAARALAERAA